MSEKFCKDCRHFGAVTFDNKCLRPIPVNVVDHRVFGRDSTPLGRPAIDERAMNLPNRCGPSGKYWEAR